MKVLNLDGLTDYNAKLLNKVEDMIDDSVSDCVNDISVTESSLMFSKKDGTSENISLSISNADTVDGNHAWEMRTLSSIGQPHGVSDWVMRVQHDVDGDGYFKIFCGDGSIQTKVDKASSSTNATNSDTVDGYHASSFCKTGFASSTNMNEMTTSGTYRINSGNTNAPSGADWGQLLVVHGGGDTIAQLIFDFNQGRCWLRTGNPSDCGGSGAWTDWRQLYTSQNITYGTSALTPGSSSLSTGSFYYQYE